MTDKEAIKYLQQLYPNGGHCWLDEQRIDAIRMAIQALQEEPISEKKCMFTKDNYTDEDRKVLCKDCDERCEYSKKEEPVSEEFEEALAREWQGYNDRGAATADALEDNTQELAFAKGFYRGAKWQEEKDDEEKVLIYKHGFENCKEQMMKDAVDACVTEIRTYYKEENEIDFTVMYEKGIIPYEMEQEVKVIVIKED